MSDEMSVPIPVDICNDKDDRPVQPKLKEFPKTFDGVKNRSFNSSWYEKYKMVEYSISKNKVYCFCCRHFSNAQQGSHFVTGYSDWKHMSKKFEDHFNSKKSNHQFSSAKYVAYIQSKQQGSVASQISIQHKEDVIRNREVLSTHVQIIILCAQQEIGLRGHREDEEALNKGNFIDILEFMKSKCPDLAKKAESMPRNAKYLDYHIQNEIIEICGKLTRHMILKEVQDGSGCFSVIADETKDKGGIEQLSLCIRYLHSGEIAERFLGFLDLHKFDAESITSGITSIIKESGLDITTCVAQTFDGASVMSGDVAEVCKKLETRVGGIVPYIHCYAHRLNLVLVDCCTKIRDVKKTLGLFQAIYNFQCHSVKRSEYFKDAQILLQYDKILEIPKSCDTTWSTQKNGITYFHNRLDSVMVALENISDDGKPDEAAESKGLLHQLQSFRRTLLIVILDKVLCHTNVLSEYLQLSDLVYTRALTLCDATITTLLEMRTEAKFKEMWKLAARLAEKVFIEVPDSNGQPESTKRRKISSRILKDSLVDSTTGSRIAECGTNEQQFRAIYYEIIDRFVQEMKRRLVDNSEILKGISASDPNSEHFLDEEVLVRFCTTFGRFQFNINSLRAQISIAKYLIKPENINRPIKCYNFLKSIPDGFPDLIKYFSLILTIPVSSATAERSFSTLNRVKSFLRATMGETRTSNLTLLSTNRDISSKLRESPMIVVDEFAKNLRRRLTFIH